MSSCGAHVGFRGKCRQGQVGAFILFVRLIFDSGEVYVW